MKTTLHRELPDGIRAWIWGLPKTETHLHIEGACPLEMASAALPDKFMGAPEFWDAGFRFASFEDFSNLFAELAGRVFVSPDAYFQCAKTVFQGLVRQNCRYVETSFALGALLRSELDGEAVVDAIRAAAPAGLDVRVFMGIRHNEYVDLGQEIVDAALSWEHLTGFDLHGPEYLPLEPWTARIWAAARDAGKYVKAHAGEFMPAAFVRRCVEELGVQRIEHGVRSTENPSLLPWLREREITLDVCPISNVKLAVEGIPTLADHPIRQLFDAGVRCTLNTDDPFFFGNRLVDEYAALYQHLAFEPPELKKLARNGFEVALVDSDTRTRFLREIDDYAPEPRETPRT